MRLIGKISVRGPFGPQDNDKIMKILDSHPFNVELMSCLPFVQRGEKKIEPVKRLENVLFGCFMSSFMDEEDDESFVSFASTKTDSFNDRSLSTPYGFHYRIHGPSWLLLTVRFSYYL